MSITASDLESYNCKQVVLILKNEDGSASEVEGKIEAASSVGIAFKEKGKREVALILPEAIEEIQPVPEKPKKLVQKKLKEVTSSTVRQHLLDRHGYARSVVNDMSDESAFSNHAGIDHSDLGHKHVAAETENEGASEESSDPEE